VTRVEIYQPRDGDLLLEVYDLRGRRVRTVHTGPLSGGWHTMTWDGRDDGGQAQASGLYFLRAAGARVVAVQKMTLLK
jgi:flagellar hook assembly protein FlgD